MCLAVPGEILEWIESGAAMRMGRVSFAGIIKDISLVYVPEAEIGDFVLVHAGFAISKIEEEQAMQVFEYLREIDERTKS